MSHLLQVAPLFLATSAKKGPPSQLPTATQSFVDGQDMASGPNGISWVTQVAPARKPIPAGLGILAAGAGDENQTRRLRLEEGGQALQLERTGVDQPPTVRRLNRTYKFVSSAGDGSSLSNSHPERPLASRSCSSWSCGC